VWGLVSIGGVSLPDPDASAGSAVQTAFMNAVGQKLARLTAWFSPESVVSGTLDETSTFTEQQKAERVDHIMNTEEVRRFFEAMFDGTFPYEKRMPGTDNDTVQTREMDIAFGGITAPTLVVHGTQDGDVPFGHAENAAAKITGARRHWMTGEDHLGFWLSPRAGEAQRVVRAFLHEHAPPR
jgi:pimeloyl-ACP methyl ester carboxylesterase